MARSRYRGPTHSYPRTARVNALLQEVLAEELERLRDGDDRLSLVTVTAVACEPDLRKATVYLASMPAQSAEALEEHRKALQGVLGNEVRMKRVPVLTFQVDPAIEAGARVEEALRRARLRASENPIESTAGTGTEDGN